MISNEWVKAQKELINKRRVAYIEYLTDDFDDLLKSYPSALKSYEKVIRDIDETNALPPSDEKNERLKYLPDRNECLNTMEKIKRKLKNIQTLKDVYSS